MGTLVRPFIGLLSVIIMSDGVTVEMNEGLAKDKAVNLKVINIISTSDHTPYYLYFTLLKSTLQDLTVRILRMRLEWLYVPPARMQVLRGIRTCPAQLLLRQVFMSHLLKRAWTNHLNEGVETDHHNCHPFQVKIKIIY